MKEDQIILVNMFGQEIGEVSKMEAHRKPMLHRAFSIFLFHGDEMLIQKRNRKKYHSGGLWTNACCSHPRKGESLEIAIHRRLREELGMDCKLEKMGEFVYYSKYEDNLYEYEYDYIFAGQYEGDIFPNQNEIEDVKWINISELNMLLQEKPEIFTTWFFEAYFIVLSKLKSIQEM